ncbi:MAG: 50S ribosomal protein L4, large subunit ribosomal protein L4 [Parcubacteria group bacterium GW2011_GWC1_41_7]|nr:MAG: 50S ribosomal protein L4, large subunit ribosomal protein L4 [Parcubacteria group bacterium GW2011_GWC1_41_7]
MKLPVFNKEGKKVQEIDVPEVFSELKKNDALVHQAVRAQQLNNYFPWAHTKDRGDVSGGGKKPWRQKGTGRARHGSIRSPIWKGGGVTFGPTNEKIRKVDLNKNMRRKAILTVIAGKIKDDQIRVIDALQFTNPKTKDIDAFLKYFVKPTKTTKFETVLLALPENDTAIIRATRNLKYADAMEARNLNILELLNHAFLFVDTKSLQAIAEIMGKRRTNKVSQDAIVKEKVATKKAKKIVVKRVTSKTASKKSPAKKVTGTKK